MIVLYMITDQFVKIAQQRQLTLLHHCGQSFGLFPTLSVPACFLNFISAFLQDQLREPS
jgi:hypothetical protein